MPKALCQKCVSLVYLTKTRVMKVLLQKNLTKKCWISSHIIDCLLRFFLDASALPFGNKVCWSIKWGGHIPRACAYRDTFDYTCILLLNLFIATHQHHCSFWAPVKDHSKALNYYHYIFYIYSSLVNIVSLLFIQQKGC